MISTRRGNPSGLSIKNRISLSSKILLGCRLKPGKRRNRRRCPRSPLGIGRDREFWGLSRSSPSRCSRSAVCTVCAELASVWGPGSLWRRWRRPRGWQWRPWARAPSPAPATLPWRRVWHWQGPAWSVLPERWQVSKPDVFQSILQSSAPKFRRGRTPLWFCLNWAEEYLWI